ncbi:DEAD/DEAH box helicase [Escherichia coli]|uniref:DEAD/DEAH box helicase n=1 Tax=Escherichia coli TaxID=562 RepID=UPI00137333AD|nr:DEAD/DEAH box helicase [Escherichia coli]NAR03465.1 DEAD/DEAH box helicase [Escherichia coli]
MLTLRNYQQNAVNEAENEWLQGTKRVCLQLPTGSGKTAIASEIIGRTLAVGGRVLFIAPYSILMSQTAAKLVEYGICNADQISYWWGEVKRSDVNFSAPVMIASAQTLARRGLPPDTFYDLVVVDECHLGYESVIKVLAGDSYARALGLSATPWREGMLTQWDRLLKPVSMYQLINDGYLVPYKVYTVQKPDLSHVRTQAGDYHQGDVAEVMAQVQVISLIVSHWLEHGENRPTIAFCVDVANANALANAFGKAGIKAAIVTAETPDEDRQTIISALRSGEIQIVCNVGVLVAGLDAPEVSCIIYAAPTKSEMKWVQAAGRGLRTCTGKADCLIFDHSTTSIRLGTPALINYPGLRPHRKKGERAKEREEQHDVTANDQDARHVIALRGALTQIDDSPEAIMSQWKYFCHWDVYWSHKEQRYVWQRRERKVGWLWHTLQNVLGYKVNYRQLEAIAPQPPQKFIMSNFINWKKATHELLEAQKTAA